MYHKSHRPPKPSQTHNSTGLNRKAQLTSVFSIANGVNVYGFGDIIGLYKQFLIVLAAFNYLLLVIVDLVISLSGRRQTRSQLDKNLIWPCTVNLFSQLLSLIIANESALCPQESLGH